MAPVQIGFAPPQYDLNERFTTCWHCRSPILLSDWGRCNRCRWRICKRCNGCRKPSFIDRTGRRGPCPREVPILADVLSLQWARDCYGTAINWAALGKKGPLNPTSNVDEDSEWLRRIAIELHLPGLRLEPASLGPGYGLSMSAPDHLALLRDPRSVALANMILEYRANSGIRIINGAGRLSVRVGTRAFGLFDERSMASTDPITLESMFALEARDGTFADILEDG